MQLTRTRPKIFCLSMQRNGTTSTGDFFEHFGFNRAGQETSWKNQWSKLYYDGNIEAIFHSQDFKKNRIFEDDPWWLPGFYKILFYRFPKSKFILFTRSSDAWFISMCHHSGGKNPGNTWQHCKWYRREKEFYSMLDNDAAINPSETAVDNLLELEGYEEHYKSIYEVYNREVIAFFKEHNPNALFQADLIDTLKWQKLGKFFGIDVPEGFEIHSNRSKAKKSVENKGGKPVDKL